MRYFNLKVLVGKKPKDTFWEKITNKLFKKRSKGASK